MATPSPIPAHPPDRGWEIHEPDHPLRVVADADPPSPPTKAAHIAAHDALAAIDRCAQENPHSRGETANLQQLHARWPDTPPKVVTAKLRKLIRRRLATGCTCGCRGDFAVTTLGYHALITGRLP